MYEYLVSLIICIIQAQLETISELSRLYPSYQDNIQVIETISKLTISELARNIWLHFYIFISSEKRSKIVWDFI